MNVLSLFDGISCGQVALNRAGIEYDKYFASETDPRAIQITQKNFPDTIQLGDVTRIKSKDLPQIDLLIGGSPCQGFSVAGKRLNFGDPRSKLFFEFVRLLNELKPEHFLLENVKMKKHYQHILTEYLGVNPVEINSNLVSAQNRGRLYWTDIPVCTELVDRKIHLESILETDMTNTAYFLTEDYIEKLGIERFRKSKSIVKPFVFTERRTEEAKRIRREFQQKYGKDFCPRRAKELVPRTDGKCNCLTTSLTKEHILLDENYNFRYPTPLECERLQTIPDDYTKDIGMPDTQRYKMIGNAWTVDVIRFIFTHL